MSSRENTPLKRRRARPSVQAWLPSVTLDDSTLLQNADEPDTSIELPDFSLPSYELPEWNGDLFGHQEAERQLKELRESRQASISPSSSPKKRVEPPCDLSSASLEAEEAPQPVVKQKPKGKAKKQAADETEDATLKTKNLMGMLPRKKKHKRAKYVEQSEEEAEPSSDEQDSLPRRGRAARRSKRKTAQDVASSDDEAREEARQKRIRHYDELPSLNVELVV